MMFCANDDFHSDFTEIINNSSMVWSLPTYIVYSTKYLVSVNANSIYQLSGSRRGRYKLCLVGG